MTQRTLPIPILCGLACLWLAAATASSQAKPSAAIPATAPTQSVSDLPSARPAASLAASRGSAHVAWDGSRLSVQSGGEALPEIVAEISRLTGMKITGGVPDESVFGNYGPASVQDVLAGLFDGLSINMMLVNDSPTQPKELILTARTGAPTPPQVRQVVADTPRRDRPGQPGGGFQRQQPPNFQPPQRSGVPPVQQQQQPANGGQPAMPPLGPPPAENTSFTNNGNALPGSTAATSTSSASGSTGTASGSTGTTGADSSNGTAPSTTTDSTGQQQSPNGVKTPEQIFEELRRRQQQQQSASPTQ